MDIHRIITTTAVDLWIRSVWSVQVFRYFSTLCLFPCGIGRGRLRRRCVLFAFEATPFLDGRCAGFGNTSLMCHRLHAKMERGKQFVKKS